MSTVQTLAGARGPLLSLLLGGLLSPGRRRRDGVRSHATGTPVLVRAEKPRISLDELPL